VTRPALALLLLALPASAQTVPDGNTITVGATTVRLWGIDAPDIRQTCDDGWAAGQEAARTLRALVQGRRLECNPRGKDRFGVTLAVCKTDGWDVGAAMVSAGAAWAARQNRDYTNEEHDAINARKGVHDHPCLLPWAWRENPR
jgi:endonuclease YncB( thermonuclease family)